MRARVEIFGHRINEHETYDLGRIRRCEDADIQAAGRMPDEEIRWRNSRRPERRMQRLSSTVCSSAGEAEPQWARNARSASRNGPGA